MAIINKVTDNNQQLKQQGTIQIVAGDNRVIKEGVLRKAPMPRGEGFGVRRNGGDNLVCAQVTRLLLLFYYRALKLIGMLAKP